MRNDEIASTIEHLRVAKFRMFMTKVVIPGYKTAQTKGPHLAHDSQPTSENTRSHVFRLTLLSRLHYHRVLAHVRDPSDWEAGKGERRGPVPRRKSELDAPGIF